MLLLHINKDSSRNVIVPVSDSQGNHYQDEFDYWHSQLFPEEPKQEDPGGENKMFFVRHGDTALNDEDLVHGWVNAPLNDRGIEQAHKAAESLTDKNITRIVSSDLPRAKQTANVIGKKLDLPVTIDPGLRTWDSGDFDYTDKHEELKKYTQAVPKDQKNVPTMKIPDEKKIPNYGPGRMFGDMVDHMQKEYDRLGIQHNHHFFIEGDPQEYRRMTPEESKDTDWDFIKVFPADPNAPQASVAPPGSSESFNQFKDRILTTVGDYVQNNDGHNTVLVTHSKPIGVVAGWEHAGYPQDDSIHMETFDEVRDKQKPGGHEEIKIPAASFQERFTGQSQDDMTFDQRFSGWPKDIPLTGPGEDFFDKTAMSHENYTLRAPPKWPAEENFTDDARFQKAPFDPNGEAVFGMYQPVGSKDPFFPAPQVPSKEEILKVPGHLNPDLTLGKGAGKLRIPEKELREAVEAGKSMKEIRKQFGGRNSTINEHLEAYGIERQPSGRNASNTTWTTELENKLKKFLNEGQTYKEIAGELGVNKNEIAGKLHRMRQTDASLITNTSGEIVTRANTRTPSLPKVSLPEIEEKLTPKELNEFLRIFGK